MSRRTAITLLELILVVGILALLVGLLIPAVQKLREAALRAKSQNNLHQITLGLHNYAAAHGSRLPGMKNWDGPRTNPGEEDALLKVIARAGCLEVNIDFTKLNTDKPETFYVPIFVDAADPSWLAQPNLGDGDIGNCSYAINTWAFQGPNRQLPEGFPDGTSQTVAITEHYMRCRNQERDIRGEFFWQGSAGSRGTTRRRATFADPYYSDVVPRVSPGLATLPSRLNATFQVAPSLTECDPTVPQTPFRAGLLVAMMDGSIRTVRPGVDPAVFWAGMTPDGGESQQFD